jgi:purine-binding chemotaxis protein CheW
VIDTRNKFGLPAIEHSINSCILVLNVSIEGQEIVIGAVVDSVQEVMEINENSIQSVPSIGAKYRTEFIQGMIKVQEQFIMMLNLDLIFTSDEMALLEGAAGQVSV